MQSVRLQNDALGRMLHNQIHNRMVSFCEQYTPELPAFVVVDIWLSRLFNGDTNLHIFVDLDDNYKIVGHSVIDVQEIHGHRIVYCHQALADKGHTSTLDAGAEYVDKLVAETGAYCSVFTVAKHIKGLEKKYGYKASRTIMVKYNEDVETSVV